MPGRSSPRCRRRSRAWPLSPPPRARAARPRTRSAPAAWPGPPGRGVTSRPARVAARSASMQPVAGGALLGGQAGLLGLGGGDLGLGRVDHGLQLCAKLGSQQAQVLTAPSPSARRLAAPGRPARRRGPASAATCSSSAGAWIGRAATSRPLAAQLLLAQGGGHAGLGHAGLRRGGVQRPPAACAAPPGCACAAGCRCSAGGQGGLELGLALVQGVQLALGLLAQRCRARPPPAPPGRPAGAGRPPPPPGPGRRAERSRCFSSSGGDAGRGTAGPASRSLSSAAWAWATSASRGGDLGGQLADLALARQHAAAGRSGAPPVTEPAGRTSSPPGSPGWRRRPRPRPPGRRPGRAPPGCRPGGWRRRCGSARRSAPGPAPRPPRPSAAAGRAPRWPGRTVFSGQKVQRPALPSLSRAMAAAASSQVSVTMSCRWPPRAVSTAVSSSAGTCTRLATVPTMPTRPPGRLPAASGATEPPQPRARPARPEA